MKKVLFVASVDVHIRAFHLPYLEMFKQKNWEVHVVSKGDDQLPFVDKKVDFPFERSPFKLINIALLFKLVRLLKENEYDLIHCHTPVASFMARIANYIANVKKTKLIYTAHGFHFYKGAPIINWLTFFPIEKALARLTDILITINDEDYQSTLKYNFKAKQIVKVNGVGIDLARYQPVSMESKHALREKYGFAKDDQILIYTAEINANKNQTLLIRAMERIVTKHKNSKLLLIGNGPRMEDCQQLVRDLHLGEVVHFLGYRNDVDQLLKIADIAVSSSYREGLPVNIMEAMATGLPVVASNNRGHRELVGDSSLLFDANNVEECVSIVERLFEDSDLHEKTSNYNLSRVKNYSLEVVKNSLVHIYKMVGVE